MKPSSAKDRAAQPAVLTFAWSPRGTGLFRVGVAMILAIGVTITLCYSLRIVVPVSLARDAPRIGKAQLILLNEETDSSLRALLSEERLPSLAAQDSVGDAPLVDDVLSVLGLVEPSAKELALYPAPELMPTLVWPQQDSTELSLPLLPAIDESLWPQVVPQSEVRMVVRIRGLGELSQLVSEREIGWSGALPRERNWRWSLVFDSAGELVLALPVREYEAQWIGVLRRFLEESFRQGDELGQAAAGLVEMQFVGEGT